MAEEYQQSIITTQLENEELRAFKHRNSPDLDPIVHETKADQGISFLC